MPNATLPGDVHVNSALSGVARAYNQSAAGFIADRVFPRVPVAKQTDFFYRYSRADWNRNSMRRRAPRTEAVVAGFGTDRDTYAAEVWALAGDIADETRANADSFWNLDRDMTNFLMMKAMISREVNFAARFLVADVWANEVDGVASNPGTGERIVWNNAASSPIEDIRAAKRQVQTTTGFMPNKLTLGATVYDVLLDHPDIIDRIKYGQTGNGGRPAIVNRETLAALFEVEEVLVAEAIQNSAAEQSDATLATNESSAHIVGNNALLTYAPPSPSTILPSAGYTFVWTGLFGGGNEGVRIAKWREQKIWSDRVEAAQAYDQKLIAADLGVIFLDIVDSDATLATSQ